MIYRSKLKSRVGNSSVVKIYIIRPKPGPVAKNATPRPSGVAFFATGPGLGLIMYIFTTLEFPTPDFNFHLLTTSVNAKYYDL